MVQVRDKIWAASESQELIIWNASTHAVEQVIQNTFTRNISKLTATTNAVWVVGGDKNRNFSLLSFLALFYL